MMNNENRCETVQQVIALGQALDTEQQSHLDSCPQCQAFLQQINQIDRLVQQNTQIPVPAGFVERVMAHIPVIPLNPGSESLLGERLLLAVSRSGMLQSVLLGLGIIVGLTQIVRFILSIFIISAVIAN